VNDDFNLPIGNHYISHHVKNNVINNYFHFLCMYGLVQDLPAFALRPTRFIVLKFCMFVC
jgi:hypothetical protein